jgi:hypothetical protein
LWNGPIECRLLRFDMVAGKMVKPVLSVSAHAEPAEAHPESGKQPPV